MKALPGGRQAVQLVLLAILTLTVFGSSLNHDFVWDDIPFLVNNENYQSLDLRRILLTPGNGVEYHPLRDLSYGLDWLMWGWNPMGFHASNLVFFILNIVAVFLLAKTALRFLLGDIDSGSASVMNYVPLFTAALFAVHPIQCETVSFVTGRNSLLAGLFTFLSCRYFLEYLMADADKRLYPLGKAYSSFVAALLSKATSISLPLILAAAAFSGRRRPDRRQLLAVLPFMFVAGVAFVVFTTVARDANIIDNVIARHQGLTLSRVTEAVQIPFFYLFKIVWPFNLSPDYTIKFSREPLSVPVVAACAAIVTVLSMTYCFRKSLPVIYFSCFWYACSLLPVLHIFPTATLVADRYAYIPSFALFFLVAYTVASVCRHYRAVAGGIMVALVLFLAVLGYRQNKIWRSDEALWRYTVQISPASVKALDNLGVYYFSRGNYEMAFTCLDKARSIDRNDPMFDFFQGYLLFIGNDYVNALASLEAALLKRPNFIDALFYSGNVYEGLKERRKAEESYRRVLKSTDPDAHFFKRQATERLKELAGM
jgi:hypothetical protein